MAKLILKDLSKQYGKTTALANLTVEINDGEFIALVGPSGCGKSTLLRMIAGLETVGSGDILMDDRRINEIKPKDRDIAMVFQNYALYPHMTVFDNMAFGLKMRRLPREEIRKRVNDAAQILGLAELLDRKSGKLSGGQQQRVAVGRAIVRQPKLFLFDEPLSNLDANLRVGMRAELIKLHKRLAATMLYVTHDQVEAMSMGDRLIVLKDGLVQQIGTPLDIYQNPANRFVAGFIGSPPMNFIPCSIAGEGDGFVLASDRLRISLPPEFIRKPADRLTAIPDVILGIRPEDIVEPEYFSGKEKGRPVSAYVEFIEPMGNEILATCRVGGCEIIIRLNPKSRIAADQQATFILDLERVRLFDPRTGEVVQ